MAIAHRLVSGAQPKKLAQKTRDHLEKNNVPAELIAQYEKPDKPTEYDNDPVNDWGDTYEVFDENGDVPVWFDFHIAFELFWRNLNKWQYTIQPLGMGSMSVPCQWDWQRVESTMKRMPQVRAMNLDELDELYQQLEILEQAALTQLQQQYKQLSSR